MELIRLIKARAPRVAMIVLSMHDEKIYAERAIRAGARGYVMKRESTQADHHGDPPGPAGQARAQRADVGTALRKNSSRDVTRSANPRSRI